MEKVGLPIKTKVVAWIMIVSGILGFLNIGAYGFYTSGVPDVPPLGISWALSAAIGLIFLTVEFLRFSSLILGLIYSIGTFFIAPVFLLRRKKWVWQFVIISLFISAILIFVRYKESGLESEGVGVLYPFILIIILLIDRKNFWKIAS